MIDPSLDPEVEAIEVDLLLEALARRYGLDFRNYARASLTRRVRGVVEREGLASISSLQDMALHNPSLVEGLVSALTVSVTTLFRAPQFFLALRHKVVPLLRTYPFIRAWCAGCSTGEEVYSLAILLEEEGLLERTRIYATDVDEAALAKARDGIFPPSLLRRCTEDYVKAGGTRSLSEHYSAAYDNVMMLPSLKGNLIFARHNLVTDASFNEFHLILCRNVMIYFNRTLQARVHHLLYDSLATFGVLGIGERESLRLTPHENDYEQLDDKEKLYRKRS